jgi:hypothetical protein
MTDRAHTPAQAVANSDGPSLAWDECVRAPTRELAQRMSGTVEVLLLWYPKIERVELSVGDLATGAGSHLEVAPGDAIDAFYHPYAYAARRENSYRLVHVDTTIVDG